MKENGIIRIGISSILCYLIFKKSYLILTSLLLWVNVELRAENEIILITLNVVCGILSILTFVFMYNRFLKNRIPLKTDIFILLSVTVFLTLTVTAINWLYGNYLAGIEMDEYRTTYLFQFGWSKGMDTIFPIFTLIYFMWRLYADKTTVGNNVYKT